MKFTKILAVIGLSIFMAAGMAGCSSSSSDEILETADTNNDVKDETEVKDTAKTLNIALQPSLGYTPLYVLRDNGWLEEALEDYGVEVKWSEFESGPPENESFAAGQQDIGVMGNVPAISGIAAGQKRSIIGISVNGEKSDGILVKSDSDINSVADLKGKKVGLVVGSISQNLLDTLLKLNGLTSNDVTILNLNVSEQTAALSTGQVDAIVTWEPLLLRLQKEGTAKLIGDGSGGVFLGENPIVARDEYIQENPTITKIFLEQYARGAAEIINNTDAAVEKYSEVFELDKEETENIYKNVNFPVSITDEDIEDLQSTADFLYETELIDKQLNIEDYIDLSYVEAADIEQYLN